MNLTTNNYKQFTGFVLVLLSLSTLISYLLYCLFNSSIESLPTLGKLLIAVPAPTAIFALLFWMFDQFLWKLRIFSYLGIVVADDLNGRWKGVVKSSWDDFKSDIPAELVITQTATRIKIRGIFNQSKSISVQENFGYSEMENSTVLYYFYRNEPKYDATQTMAMHEGSVMLAYDAQRGALTGYYYSGRDRHNHGTIEVTRL